MSSELPDEEALRRLRRDPGAVVVLYDRYVARLVAALAALSGDRELAFDLTQETFARLLERGHQVRLPPGGSAWPWLWTVARNVLRDYRRRSVVDATARARLGIPVVPYDERAVDELIARVDAQQRRPELVAALDGLPQDQRQALLARVVAEDDYREVSRNEREPPSRPCGRVSHAACAPSAFEFPEVDHEHRQPRPRVSR